AKNFLHRSIKFDGVRYAHAVDLDSHDIKSGTGEEIDDVPRTAGGESKIVRLNQDERPLGLLAGRVGDSLVEDASVRIGKLGPDTGLLLGLGQVGRGQDR